MVSSTPAGSGLPIGLMPGALPSDHASRQTLKTTAIFLPRGQVQFTCCLILHSAPIAASSYQGRATEDRSGRRTKGGGRRAETVDRGPRAERRGGAQSPRPATVVLLPLVAAHGPAAGVMLVGGLALNPRQPTLSNAISGSLLMDNANPAARPWYEIVQTTLKRND